MTPAALLFDVDGTLSETEETHRQAFNETFAAFGLPWRWVLKFVLVAGVALLLLQGLAALARSILVLRGGKA